jgi:hypothetical protein
MIYQEEESRQDLSGERTRLFIRFRFRSGIREKFSRVSLTEKNADFFLCPIIMVGVQMVDWAKGEDGNRLLEGLFKKLFNKLNCLK